jgi:hypothetical protein
MEPRKEDAKPRFRLMLQPAIVRIYKVVGIAALTTILIGLLSFLIVNIFYFFDHTWVRPVVLSPTHQKVIDASTQLADAKLHSSQYQTEKVEIVAELAEIDRIVASSDKFVADVSPVLGVGPLKTADAALLRRQIDQAGLDKARAEGRRVTLTDRLTHMDVRIKEQDQLVNRLASSPYLRAVERKLVIAFVPYQNLKNVKVGTELYGCSWGLVMCSRVGKISGVIDGEVTDQHPHDESMQRGLMVEVQLSKPAAEEERVLFAGGKPLWLF